MEGEVIGQMIGTEADAQKQKMVPIDNLVFKTFSKKFNDKYSGNLFVEQKVLLSKFASSFSDNGLELKVYLNEEVSRLKKDLKKSLLTNKDLAFVLITAPSFPLLRLNIFLFIYK